MQQIDFKYLGKEIIEIYSECLEILQELKEQELRGEKK